MRAASRNLVGRTIIVDWGGDDRVQGVVSTPTLDGWVRIENDADVEDLYVNLNNAQTISVINPDKDEEE